MRVSSGRSPERLGELRVVEQAGAWPIEFGGRRLRMADARQRPLDHQTIEAGEHADDLVRVTFDQAGRRPTIRAYASRTYLFGSRLRLGREMPFRGSPISGQPPPNQSAAVKQAHAGTLPARAQKASRTATSCSSRSVGRGRSGK